MSKRSGRPVESRNAVAGKNLRIALKILGKTWRRDKDSPHHVLHWGTWAQCNLPSSATTIDRDMRDGIPESRLPDYARCLGVLPQVLADPQSDLATILSPVKQRVDDGIPSKVMDFRDYYPGPFLEHNRSSYLQALFGVMQGVYKLDYLIEGVETIHRCVLWVHAVEPYKILVKARFIMFGMENLATGELFRWHNNLHLHYLCDNGLELGYLMMVDPMRHNLVMGRKPFWLKGRGLTDRGLADNLPVTLNFRMLQQEKDAGQDWEALWTTECAAMHKRPTIAPGDPDYEILREQIMSPESITPGR